MPQVTPQRAPRPLFDAARPFYESALKAGLGAKNAAAVRSVA